MIAARENGSLRPSLYRGAVHCEATLSNQSAILRLRSSHLKTVWMLLAGPLFTAGGWWMIHHLTGEGVFLGWVAMVISPFCLVAGIILLMPGSQDLVLRPEGFELKSLWRTELYRWDHVSGFRVVRNRAAAGHTLQCVGFSVNEPRHPRSSAVLGAFYGARIDMILPSNYGLSPSELAALMEKWRSQYI